MRAITGHIVEGDSANHQLTIEVTDAPGAGGANHRYEVTGFDTNSNPSHTDIDGYASRYTRQIILFQNGPIKEVGVNGVTDQTLAEMLIDRLRSFQNGPYACDDNAESLAHLEAYMECSKRRTRARLARGVEGTHQK